MTMRFPLLLSGLALVPGWVLADVSPLPPYDHYLPPVLTRYADHAAANGDTGTAKVLHERVQRLVGNTASQPAATTVAGATTQPATTTVIPSISQDTVPALWQGKPIPAPAKGHPKP